MKFHSTRCFHIARVCWEWLLISLFCDVAILNSREGLVVFSDHNSEIMVLGILTLISLFGLRKDLILDLNRAIANLRQRTITIYAPWLIGATVLLSIAEVFLHVGQSLTPSALIIALLLSVPVGYATFRKLRQLLRASQIDNQNMVKQVERANIVLLCISVIPALSARLLSLFAALALPAEQAVLLLGLGFMLILSLKPEESFFRGFCGRCHRPTSRALVEQYGCPICSPHRFPNASPPAPEKQVTGSLKFWPIWNRLQRLRG